MRSRLFGYAVLALLAVQPFVIEPVAAQKTGPDLVTAKNVDEIVNLARGYGAATLTKDDSGDPLIKNRTDGIAWSVYFYGCDKGADCSSIQFSAGFTMKNKPTVAKINEWNMQKRWAKARVDNEGDPIITHDVNLQHGVTRANLDTSMGNWTEMVADFTKFIGYKK
jgi:Putative bacterial sensory transduction regulator